MRDGGLEAGLNLEQRMNFNATAMVAAAAGLVMVGPALGQSNTFDIVVSNLVSPEQPSATVEVWASFNPGLYAFAMASFDVLASTDQGRFSDPFLPLKFPSDYEGDIAPDGDSVTGVNAGQIHFWNGGPYADTSNPILIWSVIWSTSKFAPRTIDLGTLTREFWVYEDAGGGGEDFINDFTEGAGMIHVVPGPGILAVLGLVAPLASPRRRQRHFL
jgi:hypothetical protein